ncbi:MAG TPA: hypothetical protein VM598_11180 [Bdellovibrionota bacterium]|nr:hypothetical protein [Bdellovibrionota bacterium]
MIRNPFRASLVLLALLASQTAIAGCALELTPAREAHFSAQLEELPYLRELVLGMLADPEVPTSLKRIISEALENPEVLVGALSDAVRAKYGIPESFEAAVVSASQPVFLIEGSEGGRTVNEQATAALRASGSRAERLHHVFSQDRAPNRFDNDLISLIHELSHVRFDEFLSRHLPRLAAGLPQTLVREIGPGRFSIKAQFYDFLTERYAAQTEWAVLKAAHGRYFAEYYGRYAALRGRDDAVVHRAISNHVIRSYEITDPEVLAYRTRTLSSILLGATP